MTGTVNKVVEQRRQQRPVFAGAVHALVLTIGLAGCTPTVTKHGHLLSQADLQQIQPGSSKEQVTTTLGTPDTTSTVDGGAYYYISTTREQKAFMKSNIIDRRVVAIYFDQFGTVENVANYGLKDGKVFDFINRETPSHAGDTNIIQRLFRGIGTPGEPPAPRKRSTI